jgi:hypothetical protein
MEQLMKILTGASEFFFSLRLREEEKIQVQMQQEPEKYECTLKSSTRQSIISNEITLKPDLKL